MISLTIHLDLACPAWQQSFERLPRKIERAAGAAFVGARKPAGFSKRNFEVNIVLADDKAVKTLNRDYRGLDRPTNVLSFPQFDFAPKKPPKKRGPGLFAHYVGHKPIPLGDVVLAWQTVKRECRAQKKPLEDHTLHLVVHGTLHLLGYDHLAPRDAKTMEKLESDILKGLGYPDPYHDSQS